MKLDTLSLCLVTKPTARSLQDELRFIGQCIEGGVTMVQLREKNMPYGELISRARAFKEFLQPYRVPLIINDFVELAVEVDAEGVHLGQQDMHPDAARALLGPHKIIGLSIETIDELRASNTLKSINYISASAVFASKTKNDYKTIWGIEGLKKITSLSTHPVMAIGGIRSENIAEVMHTGICGIAVIGALYDHENPAKHAAYFQRVIIQHTSL